MTHWPLAQVCSHHRSTLSASERRRHRPGERSRGRGPQLFAVTAHTRLLSGGDRTLHTDGHGTGRAGHAPRLHAPRHPRGRGGARAWRTASPACAGVSRRAPGLRRLLQQLRQHRGHRRRLRIEGGTSPPCFSDLDVPTETPAEQLPAVVRDRVLTHLATPAWSASPASSGWPRPSRGLRGAPTRHVVLTLTSMGSLASSEGGGRAPELSAEQQLRRRLYLSNLALAMGLGLARAALHRLPKEA
ncbi:hypothetical protein QJS66_12725 [Kocuria rhizophila]|nr:hypothetical protein QJS66_12725 [Kocuria rhizophila]